MSVEGNIDQGEGAKIPRRKIHIAKPLNKEGIEAREIDYKIAGAGSIAELLDIVATDLKSGVQIEQQKPYSDSAEELQVKILQGVIKKTPEVKYKAIRLPLALDDIVKNIKEAPEEKPSTDPLGLQRKIDDLGDDTLFPVRPRLDWLLIEAAMRTQALPNHEKLPWIENESVHDLGMMMTSDQRKQEIDDQIAYEIRLQMVKPLEIVQQLLDEGRKQKVIGKDAYNKTPEYKMAEQIGHQAYVLREELEGEGIERQPTIDLERLNADSIIESIQGRIRFRGKQPPLTFDPRKLAMGILASDLEPVTEQKRLLGENEETIHAYYPHYKNGKLVAKTEFVMPLHDASFLLKRSFKELGYTERTVGASLDIYNTLINSANPEYKELHRYSAAHKLRQS